MDFSKLDSNEKLAIYASAVVLVAGLISNWGGLLWLSILAAIAMAVVVFLPQFSPATRLPGSKGSLMAVIGIVAAVAAVIELLRYIGYTLDTLGSLGTIMFIIALIGSLVMAWAGWQELQSEGGKWVLGSAGTGTASTATTPAPPAAEAAPPAAEAAPPATTAEAPPPTPSADVRADDEDRPGA